MTHSLSPQNPIFPFKTSAKDFSKSISRLSKTNSIYPAIVVLIHEFAFSQLPPVLLADSIVVEKSKRKENAKNFTS